MFSLIRSTPSRTSGPSIPTSLLNDDALRWTQRRQRHIPTLLILALIIIYPLYFYTFDTSHFTHSTSYPPKPVGLDPSLIAYLSSPLDQPIEAGETPILGQHHPIHANYPVDYQWVTGVGRQPYEGIYKRYGDTNSAIGRMPVGSKYEAVVIARGYHNSYIDSRETEPMVNLSIVGFFADYHPTSNSWERSGPEPYVLDIPVWRQNPRLDNNPNGGPADPRFIWSDRGEPLLITGTSSRAAGIIRAVAIVDLRAVWPAFRAYLSEIGHGEKEFPITIQSFTEIGRHGPRNLYEKNWAPFFPGANPLSSVGKMGKGHSWGVKYPAWGSSGDAQSSFWPLFASNIFPRSILQVDTGLDTSDRSPDNYVLSTDIDLSLQTVDGEHDAASELPLASSDCIAQSLPEGWEAKNIHQATPFHRVTLCPRGSCIPDEENTVHLGIIHYKLSPHSYRRMFVTMSPTAPFKIISVSPPVHFGTAESDNDVVFSLSMAFFPTRNGGEEVQSGSMWGSPVEGSPANHLSHGWLDDTLVVGAGLRDAACDAIHIPVADVVRGHTLCA